MTAPVLLNITFPEKEIFLRLGGHLTKTGLSAIERQKFITAGHQAFSLCRPAGIWEIFPVETITEQGIFLQDGSFIEGGVFAARNPRISHLWCAAVTVGSEVTSRRDQMQNISEAAIFDAVAAESADSAMDLLQQMAAKELLRQALFLNKQRFSPGYADMPLSVQQFVAEKKLLPAIGVGLNENFYRTPEKSVTAFAGVSMHSMEN